MLCNEHCLFLEIAQVIRSSQLTILKGVMESRSNNTWAHFIVEVLHNYSVFRAFPDDTVSEIVMTCTTSQFCTGIQGISQDGCLLASDAPLAAQNKFQDLTC